MDMLRLIDVVRSHIDDLAWTGQHQAGDAALRVARITMAKVQATQCMQFCAAAAVQILGGMGFMRGTRSELHLPRGQGDDDLRRIRRNHERPGRPPTRHLSSRRPSMLKSQQRP